MVALLRDMLARGQTLLLVDGLDEITDPTVRAAFCTRIETIAQLFPAPLVVTSRLVGYREMRRRLQGGFERVTLADLAPEDKDDFVRRWCEVTIAEAARRKSEAEKLIGSIHGVDRIEPRKRFMVTKFLELASALKVSFEIFVGIDDSLGKKGKATKHLDVVDYHHNHNESTKSKQAYTNGYVYVEVHVQIGPFGFLFDTRLFLREKTVRRLNRERPVEKRLRYRSKYAPAREMLLELETLLPKGHKIYVLFDSWYASNKLIKFCRRQQ